MCTHMQQPPSSQSLLLSPPLTVDTMVPNTQDLTMLVYTSYSVSARRAESTMMLAGTL